MEGRVRARLQHTRSTCAGRPTWRELRLCPPSPALTLAWRLRPDSPSVRLGVWFPVKDQTDFFEHFDRFPLSSRCLIPMFVFFSPPLCAPRQPPQTARWRRLAEQKHMAPRQEDAGPPEHFCQLVIRVYSPLSSKSATAEGVCVNFINTLIPRRRYFPPTRNHVLGDDGRVLTVLQ